MGKLQFYPNITKATFPLCLTIDLSTFSFAGGGNTTISAYESPALQRGTIIDVEETGYQVIRPIPYAIERDANGDFVARIDAANIAITGTDPHDAYQALVAELLDTFDTLVTETTLGPDATAQLATLKTYLARTTDGSRR